MMENKSAIIIGAGVGGIATAIYLARNGYSVNVFEKNDSPGGRCGQIIRDGHRFDLGATIFLMPSIYKEVFESLGLSFEESLPSKPLPIIYKLHFSNGQVIDFTTDKANLKSQLEAIEPGSYQKAQTYITRGYEQFQVALRDLLGRNFYSFFDFVNFRNFELLIKIKTYLTHHSYVRRFFKHSHLKIAFTFQNIYVGQNPMTAPALFAMLPAAELSEGSLFPIGGMYSIVETLISTAKTLGVTFHYNKPIARIAVNHRKADHIVLEDGTAIHADIIVANADLPYVYRNLLPDTFRSFCLDKLRYSCSAIVFHWGLDKPFPKLGHHNVFISEHYKKSLNAIFKKQSMDDKPCFYVHAPVISDPTAAPSGQDTLSIIIPVGHVTAKNQQDWNALKLLARAAVLERFKELGMEDIEDHIKFEICHLPTTWDTALNISRGSVFGSVNHSILQMGYFRPHNKHGRYKNLYFVGGSTHPGNGVPLVLLSSKLTAERILKDR